MKPNKILMSIAILALLISVSIATNQTDLNNTNLTEKRNINVSENITEKNPTISPLENKTVNNKSINMTDVMKKAKVPAKVPLIVPASTIAYTNPSSGISTFGTTFSNPIFTGVYSEWTRYTFYLPVAAYVYIDISGTIITFDDMYYQLNVDGNQYSSWTYERDIQDFERASRVIQKSQLFYLTKGSHTVYLNGYGLLADGYYTIEGFISILAFPEYTAITVTSPNGGESWTKGTTKTISWRKDGNPGANVKIELYKAGALSSVISSNTPDDGVYSWYIPTYQPIGTDYKIKITSTSDPTKYYDWSDNYFRIY